MPPYTRAQASRAQQVSQAANHPEHASHGQFLRTPPPLGQRAPSNASVHIYAPALRAPPDSINFPSASPSHSHFVPAPHQPSPTEQRKRAKSQVGPKPPTGLSRRPSVTSSFRSPTVSPDGVLSQCFPGSHLQTTHPAYAVGDAQNSRSRTLSNAAVVSSNFNYYNLQSAGPYGQVGSAGSGYPSIAQPSISSASHETQRSSSLPIELYPTLMLVFQI